MRKSDTRGCRGRVGSGLRRVLAQVVQAFPRGLHRLAIRISEPFRVAKHALQFIEGRSMAGDAFACPQLVSRHVQCRYPRLRLTRADEVIPAGSRLVHCSKNLSFDHLVSIVFPMPWSIREHLRGDGISRRKHCQHHADEHSPPHFELLRGARYNVVFSILALPAMRGMAALDQSRQFEMSALRLRPLPSHL
jgi:hypothetical protein